jgi:hypothetical protein
MPYIDPLQMPPQRGPKSLHAVQAEAQQAEAALEEVEEEVKAQAMPNAGISSRASGGVKRPFLKTISVFDWKVDPKEIAKKLSKVG